MSEAKKKLFEVTANGMLGLAILVGKDLNLYDALIAVSSENKPATAAQVAEKAGLKERYVREWLRCLACGGIIEMDDSGERFWMTDEFAGALTSTKRENTLAEMRMVYAFRDVAPAIQNVMKKDGPLGMKYENYAGVHDCLELSARSKYGNRLIPEFLPIAGVKDMLDNRPVKALDVGCGTGFHAAECAKHYKSSYFTGIDITENAIKMANGRKKAENIENIDFIHMDAKQLPDSWTGAFDWVSMYDACHDQMRPDLSLQEIHRVLKPDGVFTMVDIVGTSSPVEDRKKFPTLATFGYGVSLFHCLPVASNSPDALGLGTMWGVKKALSLLKECGFDNVEVSHLPFAETEVVYRCKK